MLESLVTSKARVKLLLKFFLNPHVKAYLRELSTEFGGSSNAMRVELNHLVDAKLLNTEKSGRNIYYRANIEHPLYPEINSISKKMMGIDKIHRFFAELGKLQAAYITGDYARGVDSGVIDLLLIGDLDLNRLQMLITATEEKIKRKIRPLVLNSNDELTQMNGKFPKDEMLLLWGNGVN